MAYPASLEALVAAFERFPGVGRRTAERLAFHVLRDPDSRGLARTIDAALEEVCRCSRCFNIADLNPCALCADPERDGGTILVVEEPRDVEAVERSGVFAGHFHVLLGAYNPSDRTEAAHLSIGALIQRVMAPEVHELILGTDPDAEGEATALLVLQAVDAAGFSGRVTRLARGLPAGSALEYLHRGILEDALEGRVALRAGAGG